MAFSEIAYAAISQRLGALPGLIEKRMFGGVCFMLNGNMICGSMKQGALARVGKENLEAALAVPGAEPAIMGGRRMSGYALIPGPAIEEDEDAFFTLIDMALDYARALPPK